MFELHSPIQLPEEQEATAKKVEFIEKEFMARHCMLTLRRIQTYIDFMVVMTTHNVFIRNHKHTNYDYTSCAMPRNCALK